MKKFLIIIIVLDVIVITAYPQASSSASITATIVEPVTIPRSVVSDFGTGSAVFTGLVTVSPVGMHSKAGSVALPSSSGTFTAAFFSISGDIGYTCNITVPSEPLTINSGSKKMIVNSFTSDFPSQNAGPGIVTGFYVAVTPFNVTMNYN